MKRPQWIVFAAAALIAVAGVPPAAMAAPSAPDPGGLEVYVGTLDSKQWDQLRAGGVDPEDLGRRPVPGSKAPVQAILGVAQAQRLIGGGLPLTVKKAKAAKAKEAAVFRPYSGPGGIRDELAATSAAFPGLTKLETIGTTVRGVPIQAVKVTVNAKGVKDGKRPAVLYFGAQHAREWITPETTRRTMHYVLDNYGTDPAITKLLSTTELWFMPVANPDGYDLTFTSDEYRYWRKNMRDNNSDGQYGPEDGIDLNRNFAYKWGYDDEGSSPDPDNETYRGPSPQSEPETRAMDALFQRVGFEFLVNYHSAAQMLLYGAGWQVDTDSPDDQIAVALAGDAAHSAIPGSTPDLIAGLYTANGDTNTHAQATTGTIAFSPEESTCQTASAWDPDDAWAPDDCRTEFDFPDDEALIQAEFVKNLPFALSLAESAPDPGHPVSAAGRTAPDFAVRAFPDSYGRTQQIAVTARRSLHDVRLHFKIGQARERTAAVGEWAGGQRYGGVGDRFYAQLRGTVSGQKPGDHVTAWFTAAGGHRSDPIAYTVSQDLGGDVLILAAEDVTGIEPVSTDGATSARYAKTYADSLAKAGYTSDVYDMDVHGRRAPDPLGVLSHYQKVVWETGDDIVPRDPGMEDWQTTQAAADTDLAVRDYLNEGGKLLYAGQYAGYDTGFIYGPCVADDSSDCRPLSDDFQQYWLDAGDYIDRDGTPTVAGTSGAFAGFTAATGPQQHTASFLTQSGNQPALVYQHDGPGPYEPYDGSTDLFSGRSDNSYKRLTRTVDLSAARDAHLRFKTSFDTDQQWDFLFVEAHVVGTDDWTTLPDTGGLTSTDIGYVCDYERLFPHPFLAHYWGEDCSPHGTTGDWNAATGNSGGWKDFDADLSAYAGEKVEVSITYESEDYLQGYGVFLDDVRLDVDGTTATQTSFEQDLGGWTVAGPPEGSPGNKDDWARAGHVYDFGAGVATPATLYLGFGPEKMTEADRTQLLARGLVFSAG